MSREPASKLKCSGRTDGGALGCEELPLECFRRHRTAEEIALAFLASHAHQEVGRSAILDALGHDCQSELFAEADGRPDDRGIVGIREQTEHERPVDLEPVERKLLQIAQARIASAEIVEQNADAELLDALEHVEHAGFVMKQY